MPVEEITQYLRTNGQSCQKALHMQLAIHCAPFLKGIKESAVVSLPREQSVAFSGLAARAGLNWYFLLHEDGKDMVFIYRRKELERFLQKEDVSAFLKKEDICRTVRLIRFLSVRFCPNFPEEWSLITGQKKTFLMR